MKQQILLNIHNRTTKNIVAQAWFSIGRPTKLDAPAFFVSCPSEPQIRSVENGSKDIIYVDRKPAISQ